MAKYIYASLVCMVSFFYSFSQDIITKKTGEDIFCKISDISQSEIKYKRTDNLTGPNFTISKSELLMVRYENGTKEIFSAQENKSALNAGVKGSEEMSIPSGTTIKVEILQEVSSKNAKSGDVLSFSTTEPIIVGNKLILNRGAMVSGVVKDSEERRGLGKAGTLNISIDYLTMADGSKVKLNAEPKVKGKNTSGSAVAVALIVNPIFLLHKGKDAKIKRGDVFTVYVD